MMCVMKLMVMRHEDRLWRSVEKKQTSHPGGTTSFLGDQEIPSVASDAWKRDLKG